MDGKDLIVKKGETILQARVMRSSRGLVITAKAHPSIEEFFQERAGNLGSIGVANWGRQWVKLPHAEDLMVHQEPDPTSPINKPYVPVGDGFYTLSQPGNPILLDPQGRGTFNCINMSFLRLVGISKDLGIGFSIKGVLTEKEVDNISQQIQKAAKRIYLDYLRPVDVMITMSASEASYV